MSNEETNEFYSQLFCYGNGYDELYSNSDNDCMFSGQVANNNEWRMAA